MLVCAVLLFSATVRSEVVADLYSATVAVPDQSGASLARGAGEALGQVIVKVSGDDSALQSPVIATALGSARTQVQQFVFSRDAGPEGGLRARFEFDSTYVTGLITRAGLPLWTANRPRVLVWVVVESAGERNYVNPSETPELAAALRQAFDQRGVPLGFPLFDLGDATAITSEQIWGLDAPGAEAASARYQVENILLGRVIETATGQWVGDWAYLHAGERQERGANGETASDFFADGAALVAASMAARYAVAPAEGGDGHLRLAILGLASFSDYAATVNWLQSLELVQEAGLDIVSGDRAEFVITTALDAPKLAQLLQLNHRLQPVDPAAQELEYQWMP